MSEKSKNIVGGLHVTKVHYVTNLSVRHHSGIVTNTIMIESPTPLGDFRVGERITVGCDGFPESRHTVGVVRKVSHALTGGVNDFRHSVNVDLDEVEF